MSDDAIKQWKEKADLEIHDVSFILRGLGFNLDQDQPHISGERFLMTKEKLVLVGKRMSDNLRVIIKVSNHDSGKKEIMDEKRARDLLQTLSFTKESILFPKEIMFEKKNDYLFWISEFIEQKKVFVEYSLEEQFFLILKSFESQEAFHATTFEHLKTVSSVFPIFYAREYFKEFEDFSKSFVKNCSDDEIKSTFNRADSMLKKYKKEIDIFSGYLTHTDFVPHNFRINSGQDIYMLDCSAVRFGNKYEGWARFLNYMTLHNPPLERMILKYILKNRDEADYLNLRLMRVHKLGFLLQYYSIALNKTSGDLKKLTEERINFWHEVLKLIMEDKEVSPTIVEEYKKERDSLRTEEEKRRQREFAVA